MLWWLLSPHWRSSHDGVIGGSQGVRDHQLRNTSQNHHSQVHGTFPQWTFDMRRFKGRIDRPCPSTVIAERQEHIHQPTGDVSALLPAFLGA